MILIGVCGEQVYGRGAGVEEGEIIVYSIYLLYT